jgi:hypothetical protein
MNVMAPVAQTSAAQTIQRPICGFNVPPTKEQELFLGS